MTVAWSNSAYNHAASGFALTGGHVRLLCAACHVNNTFTSVASTCVSCHQANYNTATPTHATSGFDAALCASCHSTRGWRPSTWDHRKTWAYYSGKHVGRACADCHSGGVYAGRDAQCVSCHRNPHGADRVQCERCHDTNGFGD